MIISPDYLHNGLFCSYMSSWAWPTFQFCSKSCQNFYLFCRSVHYSNKSCDCLFLADKLHSKISLVWCLKMIVLPFIGAICLSGIYCTFEVSHLSKSFQKVLEIAFFLFCDFSPFLGEQGRICNYWHNVQYRTFYVSWIWIAFWVLCGPRAWEVTVGYCS